MATAGHHRLCRSHLFAPGNNERLLAKVFDAGADAVVLDLEDAVAPDAKAAARSLVAGVLPTRVGHPSPLVAVRINGIDTAWWRDDLAAVVVPGLQIIRIPKAESAAQLEEASAAIADLEQARGIATGTILLVATIESAASFSNAQTMCSSCSSLAAINSTPMEMPISTSIPRSTPAPREPRRNAKIT